MKKRILIISGVIVLLAAGLLTFSYIYGKKGHVKGAQRLIGSSEHFTNTEMDILADTITKYFEMNFKGCKLQTLTFDEARSDQAKSGNYDTPETVVLFCDFVGYPVFGSDPTLGGAHHDYSFILRYDENGYWRLLTSGYA